jgi:uncharacterized protein YdeI (YjbR/CyaY-like superfamily)
MPEISETFYTSDPQEWRAWLTNNWDMKSEIWLILPKKGSGKPRISYNDSVEQALCFGWIDSIQKPFGDDSMAQRFTPCKTKGHYSQPNIERLRYLAMANQLLPHVLEDVRPELEREFVFPDDIMQAIQGNRVANQHFQAFSPAYQRLRVAYVAAARGRPDEFSKRLRSLITSLEKGKQVGYGGIEKYYLESG